jgi:ubiquitin related modifier 1
LGLGRPANRATTSTMIHVTVELGGGLELLFGNIKRHEIELGSGASAPTGSGAAAAAAAAGAQFTARDLLAHMAAHLLRERPELFLAGDTVRPGILVLINDADWDLDGGPAAPLADGDVVAVISTLHGG